MREEVTLTVKQHNEDVLLLQQILIKTIVPSQNILRRWFTPTQQSHRDHHGNRDRDGPSHRNKVFILSTYSTPLFSTQHVWRFHHHSTHVVVAYYELFCCCCWKLVLFFARYAIRNSMASGGRSFERAVRAWRRMGTTDWSRYCRVGSD